MELSPELAWRQTLAEFGGSMCEAGVVGDYMY